MLKEGSRFGLLTVICRDTGICCERNSYYLCRCDCGGGASVRADKLRRGSRLDCGCASSPVRVPRRRRRTGVRHEPGYRPSERMLEYRCWTGMRERCSNPRHPTFGYYGGRGISVCDRWASFRNFLEDMGPRPSIAYTLDRIDPDGNYEPSNCRWATWSQQRLNQRAGRAHPVVVNGIAYPTISAASAKLGMPRSTLRDAIRRGG
jgi:hypothetical protein